MRQREELDRALDRDARAPVVTATAVDLSFRQ
jgi:hypothetical protein